VTEPDFIRQTRASYDAIAADYAQAFEGELAGKPFEKAVLAAFAEHVHAGGGGPVVEAGSGPGQTMAHLHALGLDVTGVELSPRMVELARAAYPGLRFTEGSMTALDAADGSLGGLVAMYSIIHIPEPLLPGVFAEFHRVLRPGGQLLVVFQVGDAPRHLTERFGHPIALDYFWRQPDQVAGLLASAGLPVHARLVREPDAAEKAPRALFMARKQG
jgi:SAM-dependent methyltransferase